MVRLKEESIGGAALIAGTVDETLRARVRYCCIFFSIVLSDHFGQALDAFFYLLL
jgi:hypothetical protein